MNRGDITNSLCQDPPGPRELRSPDAQPESAGPAGELSRGQSPARASPRSQAQIVLPVALALVLSLVGAGRALWLDEVATLGMAQLPVPQLLETLGRIDAVHGAYYLGMHAWTSWFGTDPLTLRIPSAIATAAASAAVVLIGLRLGGRSVALASGLAFALMPIVTDYGMEARSYAFTSALVAWSSYWLVAATRGSARHWVLYSIFLGLGIVSFVYAALIVPAHGLTLAAARASRGTWRRFLVAGSLVGCATLPFVLLTLGQRGQVSWLPPSTLGTLLKVPFTWMPPTGAGLVQASALVCAIWVLVGYGLVTWWRGMPRDGSGPRRLEVPHLAVPWLAFPITLLLTISLVTPIFTPRYVVFSAPALALLIGFAITLIPGRRTRLVTCILLVALCIPSIVGQRQPAGRDSWALKESILAEDGRPGDVVMATPYYYMAVIDVGLGPQFVRVQDSGTNPDPITWVEADPDVVSRRLVSANRVWLIPFDDQVEPDDALRLERLLEESFDLVERYPAGNAFVRLYERSDSSAAARAEGQE